MLACYAEKRRAPANGYLFLSLLISALFTTTSTACSNGNCQLLESCSAATDCGPGLYCGNCPAMGKTQPICTRGQSIIPTSVINGLPFNKYSWLVTHNSFSIVDAPSVTGVQRITLYNQEDTVTNQLRTAFVTLDHRSRVSKGDKAGSRELRPRWMIQNDKCSLQYENNGVRGLMLDMYDFENDIWLCHSFRGQCYNFTAFQPAINTLKEVEAFLSENPTEIVTIIIEDYVHAPKGLTKLFTDSGLDKYWFPVSKMPKKGDDWPTVTDMIKENHRLLVFTSDSSKEANEGIAYQWRYMVENEAGDPGVQAGSCPNRKESRPLNSKSASLFFQNYFPTYPVQAEACKENSNPLIDMVGTCYKATGNLMPNFVAVNFYMRSDGGGVFDAVDRINGQKLCGCSTVTACQAGAPFGACKNTPVSTSTSPTNIAGSFSGSVQLSGSASSVHFPDPLVFGLFYLFLMFFCYNQNIHE